MEHTTTALVDLLSTLSQHLLVQLLIGGTPRAYAELFEVTHITHKEDTLDGMNKEMWMKINDRQSMKKLTNSLSVIEISSSTGSSSTLFEALIEVANIFEEAGDYHKSIFYYNNGLKVAEGNGVGTQRAQVKFSLGRVYTTLNSFILAVQCFEEYIELASSLNHVEGIEKGADHLLQIYIRCAKEAQELNLLDKSIQFYMKCIESASIGDNDKVIALTGHKIGLLHYRMQQPLISLEYQMKYLTFCKLESDKVGKSKAHTALAQVYESLGQVKEAINHLEELLDVAKLMDRTTEARAYCRLGMIYARHSQLDYATTYFERFYTSAWTMRDAKMLATAAINLGITRCAKH